MQYHDGQISFLDKVFADRFNSGVAHGRVHVVGILLVGAHIVQSHNLQPEILRHFRVHHIYTHLPEQFFHRIGAHIAIVVACHKIDGCLDLFQWLYGLHVEVVWAFKAVAGEEHDVGIGFIYHIHQPLHMPFASEMTKMRVGKQHGAHGFLQLVQLYGHGREARYEGIDRASDAQNSRQHPHDEPEGAGREMGKQLHNIHRYGDDE